MFSTIFFARSASCLGEQQLQLVGQLGLSLLFQSLERLTFVGGFDDLLECEEFSELSLHGLAVVFDEDADFA